MAFMKSVWKGLKKIFRNSTLTIIISLGVVGGILVVTGLLDLLPTFVSPLAYIVVGILIIMLSGYFASKIKRR